MDRRKILILHYRNPVDPPDPVVEQVKGVLERQGHEVHAAEIFRDVNEIVAAVRKHKADLVFNLCETFDEDPKLEANVAALLELLGQPFTGSGPIGLLLAQDKVLTKKLIAAYGVRAPSYAVFYPDRVEVGGGPTRFPLLVKPSSLDASIGIHAKSVVHDWDSLRERVRYVQKELFDAALVEEFIEGRELYVGVLGNGAPQALPVLEMTFKGYEKHEPKILTSDAKWAPETEEYKKTKVMVPRRLSPALEASVQQIAVQAFLACHLRDYGRVDLRVRRGKPFVLEVNPNPYLAQDAELATAAKAKGLDYEALVGQLVDLAWARYHPGPGDAAPEASGGGA